MSKNKSDDGKNRGQKVLRGKFPKKEVFNSDENKILTTSDPLAASTQTELSGTSSIKNQYEQEGVNLTQKIVPIKAHTSYDQSQSDSTKINLSIFPFHHLVSIKNIIPSKSHNETIDEQYFEKLTIQDFWCALTSNGFSAQEVVLLKESLQCQFLKKDVSNGFLEIFWSVLYFDPLEGCAEFYRAEMMTIKRLVYESNDPLRSVLILSRDSLLPYLEKGLFEKVNTRSSEQLFFNSLLASFTLTLSSNDPRKSSTNNQKREKQRVTNSNQNPFNFNSHVSYNSKKAYYCRIDNEFNSSAEIFDVDFASSKLRNSENNTPEGRAKELSKSIRSSELHSKMTYLIELSNYWLDWQRLARRAVLDFDFLANLDDIRAIRFYELTNLWRAIMVRNTGDPLPSKMEIGYMEFASLMPLPVYDFACEIESQIKDLIKPFKRGIYLKSFSVKKGWMQANDQKCVLVFRFIE